MLKNLSLLLCLLSFGLTSEARAQDNLTLSKFSTAASTPAFFIQLGGGSAMTSKTYVDDENKVRTDKIYYTTTHSYGSTFRPDDLNRLLNPANGRLGELFEDTTVRRSAAPGAFDVMMIISTPIKNFDCASTLKYTAVKQGLKTIHFYRFTNFSMIFTDMVIQVEVEQVGTMTRVKLGQIAAVKGSAYSKLKSFLAVGKFEKALRENIKRFKDGVRGV